MLKKVQDAIRKDFAYVFSVIQYPEFPRWTCTIFLRIHWNQWFGNHCIRALHYKLPILGFRFGDFTISQIRITFHRKKWWKFRNQDSCYKCTSLGTTSFTQQYTEAIKIIGEFKPEKAYLTHLSHQAGKYEDLIRKLPDGIEPDMTAWWSISRGYQQLHGKNQGGISRYVWIAVRPVCKIRGND